MTATGRQQRGGASLEERRYVSLTPTSRAHFERGRETRSGPAQPPEVRDKPETSTMGELLASVAPVARRKCGGGAAVTQAKRMSKALEDRRREAPADGERG